MVLKSIKRGEWRKVKRCFSLFKEKGVLYTLLSKKGLERKEKRRLVYNSTFWLHNRGYLAAAAVIRRPFQPACLFH